MVRGLRGRRCAAAEIAKLLYFHFADLGLATFHGSYVCNNRTRITRWPAVPHNPQTTVHYDQIELPVVRDLCKLLHNMSIDGIPGHEAGSSDPVFAGENMLL